MKLRNLKFLGRFVTYDDTGLIHHNYMFRTGKYGQTFTIRVEDFWGRKVAPLAIRNVETSSGNLSRLAEKLDHTARERRR